MASSAPAGHAKNMLVFVLAGQSNMAGNDQVVPPENPIPRVYDITFGEPRPAVDPLGDATGFGPGRAIGRELARMYPGRDIGLVMCAQGSTGMERWRRGGDLFNRCVERAKRTGNRISGLFFGQGENDTEHLSSARQWASGFKSLVSGFRSAFGPIPVVFSQLGRKPHEPADRREFFYWREVKNQQASIKMSGVVMIRTDDIPSEVHYTWRGYQDLGLRYADALDREDPNVRRHVGT